MHIMFSLLETESSYTYIKYVFCWHKLSLILLETKPFVKKKIVAKLALYGMT